MARYLDACTPCTVSRRGRTVPDTGDIEGLAVPYGGYRVGIVVECKNTPSAPLLAQQFREALIEANNNGLNTLPVLAKKVPGVNMLDGKAGLHPTLTTETAARILNIHVRDMPDGLKGDAISVLKQVSAMSGGNGCAYRWTYQKARGFDAPAVVVRLDTLAHAITGMYGKARAHGDAEAK